MRSFKAIAAVFFVVFSNGLLTASIPPPVTGTSPGCWPPPCVPVDNGVVFLIIAGTLYGAKKIYDARKKALTNS